MPLQIRRGTEAERQVLASPLVQGELLWITDDKKLYIGDGVTLANALAPVTGYGDAQARDAAASIFTAATHSGISFSYNGDTELSATVSYPALLQNLSLNGFNITGTGNIAITGNLTVDGLQTSDFKGTVSADDSTILVNAVDGSINLNGTVKGDIIPDQNEAYDLGSAAYRFKDLYLSGTSLFLGAAEISAIGAAVDLPIGSTIGGVSLVGDGVIPGSNYNINIVGDDSTLLVNCGTKEFNGTLSGSVIGSVLGDVRGSVFADDSTKIVDAVEAKVFAVGGFFGDLDSGDVKHSDGSLILDNSAKKITVQEILLSGASTISGTPVFVSDTTSFVSLTPSVTSSNLVGLAYSNVVDRAAQLTLGRVRGTAGGGELPVQSGDVCGRLNFAGFNTITQAPLGALTATATSAASAVNFPGGKLEFNLSTGSGTTTVIPVTIKPEQVEFAVPPMLPVVADDSARTTLVPTPAVGMLIFMQSGTTPAATNKVQVWDGSGNWVNLH